MTPGDVHENAGRTNEGDKKCIQTISSSQKYQLEKQSIRHCPVFAFGDQTSLSDWPRRQSHRLERAHSSKN